MRITLVWDVAEKRDLGNCSQELNVFPPWCLKFPCTCYKNTHGLFFGDQFKCPKFLNLCQFLMNVSINSRYCNNRRFLLKCTCDANFCTKWWKRSKYHLIYPFYHINTSTLNSETWRASIEELCIIFTLIVYNMENEWQIIGLQDAKKMY